MERSCQGKTHLTFHTITNEEQKMKLSNLMIAVVAILATLAANCPAETIPYADSKIVPPTDEWVAKVEAAAPAKPTVCPGDREPLKVLVFSLRTGYNHLVMPHVDRTVEVLGKKSGLFKADVTVDIDRLAPDALAKYDILVLNNNCSKGPRRNLLLDELESNAKYSDMTETDRAARAAELERSILDFVEGGKGLVAIHGAPTMINNSEAFTAMVGAAFHYHPPNQAVTVNTVDADHPLVAAFKGKGSFIHRDEPYCFNGTYERLDFRPLLKMETEGMKGYRTDSNIPRYVSWIRPHGKGRVFYLSPSHFPASYESTTMLQFMLDGFQYVAGDLKCDDSTPEK